MQHRLDGTESKERRRKVLTFIHASEGTIMLHALAILYLRASATEEVKRSGSLKEMEGVLARNVVRDLDWLEGGLKAAGTGGYLAGEFSAADTMMVFGILFIFKRDLTVGRTLEEWPGLKSWVERCTEREAWKRAVEKTGFVL